VTSAIRLLVPVQTDVHFRAVYRCATNAVMRLAIPIINYSIIKHKFSNIQSAASIK